jgi:hypothetical protein
LASPALPAPKIMLCRSGFDNQVPVAVLQRSQQLAGIGIECVDESIAKDENVVAERRRRRIR